MRNRVKVIRTQNRYNVTINDVEIENVTNVNVIENTIVIVTIDKTTTLVLDKNEDNIEIISL